MAINLTEGAIAMLSSGDAQEADLKPVVQVVDLRLVNTQNQNQQNERYRVLLSDGVNLQQGILATQKNDLVHTQAIQKGSIVQLSEFVCNLILGRTSIIVIDLNVILDKCDVRGEPKHFDRPGSNTNSAPAARSSSQVQSNVDQPGTMTTSRALALHSMLVGSDDIVYCLPNMLHYSKSPFSVTIQHHNMSVKLDLVIRVAIANERKAVFYETLIANKVRQSSSTIDVCIAALPLVQPFVDGKKYWKAYGLFCGVGGADWRQGFMGLPPEMRIEWVKPMSSSSIPPPNFWETYFSDGDEDLLDLKFLELDKYYVVDAGYTNMPGYLAPHRGRRSCRDEFNGTNMVFRTPMELFNYKHSSLRNVIERCFGVLKGRGIDEFFEGFIDPFHWAGGNDNQGNAGNVAGVEPINMSPQNIQLMVQRREQMAFAMWDSYGE
ncbi:hypothetical protein Vadar_000407 [Vaccinium darrowii]|uniref:Uncharacterized protein n=1 Tax=Vaccinium darrowii TaxID=229202 RepID=A0ACB7WWN5_9ERIC|nr:hypothetical protein Vadar_000407 [Vaccinium darrowii]